MSARWPMAFLALASVFGCEGACLGDSTTPFDPAVGYQPLEPCTAAFPEPIDGDAHPETIVTLAGSVPGHHWAHGAAFVHASLADVYEALHEPMASHIHGPDMTVTLDVEPEYPISFKIRYEAGPVIRRVDWTILYRGGPLDDLDPPQSYGLRYQRVEGNDNVKVQDGSLVATDVGDGVTALQFVCWLDATNQGPENVRGTVTDWYADLKLAIDALPP